MHFPPQHPFSKSPKPTKRRKNNIIKKLKQPSYQISNQELDIYGFQRKKTSDTKQKTLLMREKTKTHIIPSIKDSCFYSRNHGSDETMKKRIICRKNRVF